MGAELRYNHSFLRIISLSQLVVSGWYMVMVMVHGVSPREGYFMGWSFFI